ncbi:leucine-rich repeat flightless-interacting protein 2 isoform X2 [Arctopsyche grandis]|uniref:leucine-rich repeat flightless-interacting protein 2 isoform X2 n=1 Tax=Arctopsyche grandis TaxID=121162 RepID=UPI00406D9511
MDSSGRRQRTQTKASAEDQALDQIAKEAEARLAARRQARAEARDIRMKEIERQQKEQEENADRAYDMYSETYNRSTRVAGGTPSTVAGSRISATAAFVPPNSYHSSRRSSEDSLEEMGSIRDLRHELKEVEEKFRKAMILNAQLDNDKASFSYQLELLKDKLEDFQELYTQLQREHKDKCRAHDNLAREFRLTKEELDKCVAAVALRDRCIQEAGLELVAVEAAEGEGPGAALVSRAGREALEAAGQGTLDVRLQTLCSERQALVAEVRQLKMQLDDERSRKKSGVQNSHNGPMNGSDSDSDSFEHQRETSKLVADYKFRASKAEQDVLTLQATVTRLESQVIRYKSAMEQAEKVEDELKCDRRKLQRETREAQSRVEELETENSHLNKRLDKLKNAKSALLKEL